MEYFCSGQGRHLLTVVENMTVLSTCAVGELPVKPTQTSSLQPSKNVKDVVFSPKHPLTLAVCLPSQTWLFYCVSLKIFYPNYPCLYPLLSTGYLKTYFYFKQDSRYTLPEYNYSQLLIDWSYSPAVSKENTPNIYITRRSSFDCFSLLTVVNNITVTVIYN